MKIIIPSAGAGKRLFPHTQTKPKPMVSIAGKPIIGHILDRMIPMNPDEVLLIVGYQKEQLIRYVDEEYSSVLNIRYITQEERLGLAHAIYMAKEHVLNSTIMIVLGDMIFKSGYTEFLHEHLSKGSCAASIGTKQVNDPEKYGIVELDADTATIKSLEEKPVNPKSDIGIAGVYFVNDTKALFDAIEWMIANNIKTRSEYQLTDALQEMVSRGFCLKAFDVSSWYDCGHAKSLIEANRILLNENESIDSSHEIVSSVILHPVSIGKNVRIVNSIIGPNTSIASGTSLEHAIVSESIIGSRTVIANILLHSSVIGDDVSVIGKHNSLNIGDFSSIEF